MESLGRSVLEKNLERLKASDVDPFVLAFNLRTEGIIAKADVLEAGNENQSTSERWGNLVTTVMKNTTEGTFQKFIDALLKESELEQLGNEMRGI